MKKIKEEHLNQLADYTRHLYRHPELRHLFLEFTLQCNENCFHCGSRATREKREELTADDWLDTFNMFSIYQILPELLSLWAMNEATTSTAKKK